MQLVRHEQKIQILLFFKEKFIMPVKGIISGVYGSQRILNGKPRWPHYGIDIAAKKGTPIKSSGRGVVTMAEKDLYYTGGNSNNGSWSWYINNLFTFRKYFSFSGRSN